MKKNIFILILTLFVFYSLAAPVKAAPVGFPWENEVITMINTVVDPISNLLVNIQSQVGIINSNITGIFTRLTKLENMELGPDFNLPPSWIISVLPENQQITISTSRVTGNTCSWNGILLTQQITIRGILHLPSGDLYAIGTCDSIAFRDITNFPSSGMTVPVDLHLFWQGKLKHTQINIIIP